MDMTLAQILNTLSETTRQLVHAQQQIQALVNQNKALEKQVEDGDRYRTKEAVGTSTAIPAEMPAGS